MEKSFIYGAVGCFAGTILSMILIPYNPNLFLLILLPMWGFVMGVAIGKVIELKKRK